MGPSRHYTVIFTIFVFMQVVNMLNCRKIDDEFNIFEGITRNWLFGFIWGIIVIVQAILSQYGNIVFACNKDVYIYIICSKYIGPTLVPLVYLHGVMHWLYIC